jgi:hypothetical protein
MAFAFVVAPEPRPSVSALASGRQLLARCIGSSRVANTAAAMINLEVRRLRPIRPHWAHCLSRCPPFGGVLKRD